MSTDRVCGGQEAGVVGGGAVVVGPEGGRGVRAGVVSRKKHVIPPLRAALQARQDGGPRPCRPACSGKVRLTGAGAKNIMGTIHSV